MKNLLWLLIAVVGSTSAQQRFPKKHWEQYASAEEAGFSRAMLDSARMFHQTTGGAALLVVYDGAIVLSIGDPTRKFMDHSMRKSYMSAMFGIYANRGKLDLNKTLGELGIDDNDTLTQAEKQATVKDLLSARSGVYHGAAYSPRGMAERLPGRGSHQHGTFWYYNNWDFNTLCSIFNQETNSDFFESFKSDIADAIQMEDFDLQDTFYRYEKELSVHPAYLLRLSARDEARFGLLYLRNGKWIKKQLVPSDWIEESTRALTTDLGGFGGRGGYGYLWWTGDFEGEAGYYASGSGGQRIAVIPSRKLVIVQSTDTYDGSKIVGDDKIDALINMIVRSQDHKPAQKAILKPFEYAAREFVDSAGDPKLISAYTGDYVHRFLGKMSIGYDDGKWTLNTSTGVYVLHPKSDSEFIPEDIEHPIIMQKAATENERGKIKAETASDRSLLRIIFLY